MQERWDSWVRMEPWKTEGKERGNRRKKEIEMKGAGGKEEEQTDTSDYDTKRDWENCQSRQKILFSRHNLRKVLDWVTLLMLILQFRSPVSFKTNLSSKSFWEIRKLIYIVTYLHLHSWSYAPSCQVPKHKPCSRTRGHGQRGPDIFMTKYQFSY